MQYFLLVSLKVVKLIVISPFASEADDAVLHSKFGIIVAPAIPFQELLSVENNKNIIIKTKRGSRNIFCCLGSTKMFSFKVIILYIKIG